MSYRAQRRIGPLAESDLKAVCTLAREIWYQHYPGIITVSQIEYMLDQRYRPDAIRAQISTGEAWWFGVWVGSELAGFAACEAGAGASSMKLDKLYVHLRHRGQGHGTALIRHVEAFAAEHGCDELYLQVNKYNSQSIKAYLRNGFAVSDAIKMEIGSGFVMDDYIMRKRLKVLSPERGPVPASSA
jgi:GNAT superfamily N-acetyltransferase